MDMGIFKSEVTLSNPIHPELSSVKVWALVDTGAMHLCIPARLAEELGLKEVEKRSVILADGRKLFVPYVGPLKVAFGNRYCFVGAMVLGHEPLLGAIPLEDMDLVVDPARRRLMANPENPDVPGSMAMLTVRRMGGSADRRNIPTKAVSPIPRYADTPIR